MPVAITRRRFHALAAGAVGLSALPLAADEPKKRLKVAAVVTEFTYRSHAHVILENFLEPYLFCGRRIDPGMEVASLFVDQTPAGHMTDDVAKAYRIPVFNTIADALTLGGKELAVDAVLSIGEHGKYPTNKLGQLEYPRKRFFDEIVAVVRRSKRVVPLFTDKHLSYRWDWAKEMFDTAKDLGIPLLAGSSVPLAQRIPPFELPKNAEIAEAVSVHGGGVESYDFHALEVLQSIVEARNGGETGVSAVEFVSGDAVWNAARAGRFSLPLADAAMAAELGDRVGPLEKIAGTPHALLLTYKDGLKATALKLGGSATRWNFACTLKGDTKPRATRFHVGPWQNRNLFRALSHAIQHHFRTGKPPYPAERTLLASGVLDAAMHSRADGKPHKTPHLEFAYQAQDFTAMRETGDTWKVITDDTPQPKGVDTGWRDYGRK